MGIIFYSGDHPSQWRVRLGSAQANSGGVVHTVSNIRLHENYVHRILLNDIAIVRLSSNAQLSSSIGVARIAGSQYNLPDNARVYAAGYGDIRVIIFFYRYSIKLYYFLPFGQTWRSGTKCDCKTNWLWVRGRGVEFCHSPPNASRIRQKVGNRVS